MSLEPHFITVNGVTLHVVSGGSGPTIIFLHGFPACWAVWKRSMEALQDSFHVIALDGRGVNLSSKPATVDAYQIDVLALDVIGVADAFALVTFFLVGHDWGGTLAWKVAQHYSERVERMVIINAPPLDTLLYALAVQPQQREASAYMERLKAPTAEAVLLADNADLLWQISFAGYRNSGVYTAEDEAYDRQAWHIGGALTGFLNWYRANIPPFETLTADAYAAAVVPPIAVPGLLLWGEHEKAFTPALCALIPHYAPYVSIHEVASADHWIMLDQPTDFPMRLRTVFSALG